MEQQSKFEETALFLLKYPPIDEIGGTIVEVIDQYRYGTITEKQALNIVIDYHKPLLQKYIDRDLLHNSMMS